MRSKAQAIQGCGSARASPWIARGGKHPHPTTKKISYLERADRAVLESATELGCLQTFSG
jgi:hypothetical protein